MASLTDQTVASTYDLLMKVESSGIDGNLRKIEDGTATVSAIRLSTGAVQIKQDDDSDATLTVTGVTTLSDTTDSSSSTTGGTIISGGCGIAQKLFIGTALDVTGASALAGAVTMGAAATVATTLGVTGVITASGGVTGDLTGEVTATGTLANGVTAHTQDPGTDDITVATTAYVDALTTVPTGAITQFAVAAAPTGWLLCDGDEYDEEGTHSALFDVIGSTYNTGGETTGYFRVPNFKGRMPIGVGTGSGLTARALAATGGAEKHTLITAEMPSHTHEAGNYKYLLQITDTANFLSGGDTVGYPNLITTGQITATGGSGEHENMSPFLVVNYIIKT